MEQEENFDLLEYAYALWRRRWLFAVVSLSLLAAALFVITQLPVVYRSTGTILIERQEIPEQWVNSTVTSFAEERIQAIGQRVLTTNNLLKIIEKYDLFPDKRKKLTSSQIADRARNNFSVKNVLRKGSQQRNAGTAAFLVSYDDASAEKARDVANELVTLYLDENQKSRTQAAIDTRLFLEEEADRIERQLVEIESKISEFKESNTGVLPEHQQLNIQSFERIEQEITSIDSTLTSLEERKIVLESSIGSARRVLMASQLSASSGAGIDPDVLRLSELKSELVKLEIRYSSSHPDLIRTKREVSMLEAQLGSAASGGAPNNLSAQDDPAIIQLDSDLKSTIAEQNALNGRKIQLRKKLESLEIRINKTPGVELEYRTLIRDHDNIQEKYNDIRSKQNSARVSQSLEEEQKGERFTLIEAPQLAARPHSPNYSKMYMMAFGLALLSGIGSVFGLEFLDGTIRNVKSVEQLSGVPVLATVGLIEAKRESQLSWWKKVIFAILLLLMALGALYLVKKPASEIAEIKSEKRMEMFLDSLPATEQPR